MVTETDVRRWRLQAWSKTNEVIHDSTCVGDRELDDTIASLERRKDFKRFSVAPEAKTSRPSVRTIEGAPPPDLFTPPPACRECDQAEPECRRREAVSGHTFTPRGVPS